MGMSRRAYAAHRKARGLPGGSHTAVGKAIDTGRISILADGTIDPAQADAQWSASTDAALQRSPEAQRAGVDRARETIAADERKPLPASAVQAVNEGAAEGAESFGGGGGGVTYNKARAAEMAIRAQRSAILLKRLRGEVVDRQAAKQHVFDLARKERDHWLQLPARVAAMLASELEVDAHAMEIALDRVIRDHLALLAEIKVEFASAQV